MVHFKYLIIGFIIGVGCIAPGVSGGSLAIAFGIYDRLIGCAVHWKKKLLKELKFLIPLGIGGVAGVAVFGFGLSFLFDEFEFSMRLIFAGLMLGTFPSTLKTSCKEGFKNYYPLLFIASLAISVFGFNLIASGGELPLNTLTAGLGGFIFGFGTIIPGVSSSAILIALGLYQPMLERCTSLDFGILIPVAAGILLSGIMLLKLVEWLFNKFYGAASFIFFGLLGGSTVAIIPKITEINLTLVISLILAIMGAVGSYLFGKKFDNIKEKPQE